MGTEKKPEADGIKEDADDRFDYQEEYIRQAPPSMDDVKKLPKYDQERPVVKHTDEYDHEHEPKSE